MGVSGRRWNLDTGLTVQLALALDGSEKENVLSFSLGSVCVGAEAPLSVDLLLNGERVATRAFGSGDPILWNVELPEDVRTDGTVDVSFLNAEPRSPLAVGWSTDDDRPLGILIHAVAFKVVDRSLQLNEVVDFASGSGGDRLLGEGWWELEPTGVGRLQGKRP